MQCISPAIEKVKELIRIYRLRDLKVKWYLVHKPNAVHCSTSRSGGVGLVELEPLEKQHNRGETTVKSVLNH